MPLLGRAAPRLYARVAVLGFAALVFQLIAQRECLYLGVWDAPDGLSLIVLNLSSGGIALGLFLAGRYRSALARRSRWLPWILGSAILFANAALVVSKAAFGGVGSACAIAALLPAFVVIGLDLAQAAPADSGSFLLSLNVGAVVGAVAYQGLFAHASFEASFPGLALVTAFFAVRRPAVAPALALIGAAALAMVARPAPATGVAARAFTPLGVIEIRDSGAVSIDGQIPTHLARAGDLSRIEDQARAPYVIHRPKDVLVIGVGGGQDIAAALRYGARSVTGIEVNRYLVDMIRSKFSRQTNGLFSDPRVHIVTDEGRHALRYLDERFDLIVIQRPWTRYLYDRFTHNTSALLLTRQALGEYWARLSPSGLLFVSFPADSCSEPMSEILGRLPSEAADRTAVVRLVVQNQFRQTQPQIMCLAFASKKGFARADRSALASLGGEFVHFAPARGHADADRDVWMSHEERRGFLQQPDDRALLVFLAAVTLVSLGLISLPCVRPSAADFPAALYAILGAAYFCLEARLLVRASFFLGDMGLAYVLVACSFLLFGGLGYLHAARIPRARAAAIPLALAAALVLADERFSLMWDRALGPRLEPLVVCCVCGALGYLSSFPFGWMMSRESRPMDALAWDGIGAFVGFPAAAILLAAAPGVLAWGTWALYGVAAGWLLSDGTANGPWSAPRSAVTSS